MFPKSRRKNGYGLKSMGQSINIINRKIIKLETSLKRDVDNNANFIK